jgi:hypothetical protein
MKCIIELNSSELIKVINNGILLELAESTSKADEAAKVAGEIINQEQQSKNETDEVKTKSSRKKKESAEKVHTAETQPESQMPIQQQAIQHSEPEPQPQPATCGTCETFTSDTALHSVGKCDNPAGQNVNGWTPTDNTSCNAYTPPPVQTIIPTTPQPVQQQPQAAPPPVVPTTPTTYKLSDIQLAAQQLMDAGKQQELRNLLTSFGVQALVKLPPEQYANFATQLRAMGARI